MSLKEGAGFQREMSLKGYRIGQNRRMIVILETRRLRSLAHIRAFLEGTAPMDTHRCPRAVAYAGMEEVLERFGYGRLGKADKGLVRRYLERLSGLSRAQVGRLVRRHLQGERLRDRRGAPAAPFTRRYTRADILLLAEVDALHGTLSGPATRKLCERAFKVFHDQRFQRLARISNGHLYNLRHSLTYQRRRGPLTQTRPVQIPIGERRRPTPQGCPGHVRVDTVHQGDQDGAKGLYHINLVDEVTQFQMLGAVEGISERYLLSVLETLLQAFPFRVLGFHADNGTEYINYRVAALLNKLHIGTFTKSRARRSNDNALVESKNGSVVRKYFGYAHIPRRHAAKVNAFAQQVLCPYLNFHRPCLFPHEQRDARGRVRRRYRYEDMATPYEKLKSLPDAASHLQSGVNFRQLDAQAYACSDHEAARRLQQARDELFEHILCEAVA